MPQNNKTLDLTFTATLSDEKPEVKLEVAALVSPEVAATLDPEATYRLWAFNKRRTQTWNERSVVEAARRNVKSRARKPSGAARRFWELSGGIARCAECGSVLSPHTVISGDGHKRENHYYSCRSRYNDTAKTCENRHSNRAEELEALVWEAVSETVSDEDAIREKFDSYADFFRRSGSDESRARLTAQREKLEGRRSNLIDMAADGTITRDDLRVRLAAIEEESEAIRRELKAISGDAALAREIEVLRDSLIEGARMSYYQHISTPKERYDLYRRMGLTVEVDGDGNAMISGALLPGGAFVSEDSRRPPAPRRRSPPPR